MDFLKWAGYEPGYCVICGSPYIQIHHIFHGSHKRKFSERYGYKIPLCMDHHTGDNGIHQWKNKNLDLKWKRKAQRHFEIYFGTRANFINECGKSYIKEDDDE